MSVTNGKPDVSPLAAKQVEAGPYFKSPALTAVSARKISSSKQPQRRLKRRPGKPLKNRDAASAHSQIEGSTRRFPELPGGVRLRLVGAVFLLITPAALLLYVLKLPWGAFTIGVVALIAAWVGGEFFVMRQVRVLIGAIQQLREGNLAARTGISTESGELGELARSIDGMAGSFQKREADRQGAEYDLMIRAQQQTGAAALGQFALATSDYESLVQQAVSIIANSLDLELCDVQAVDKDGRQLTMQTGFGWTLDSRSDTSFRVSPVSLSGYALTRGEPVIISDWDKEKRFRKPVLFSEHHIRSSACVPIRGRTRSFGLLSVHSTRARTFSGDDIQFLLAGANHLAMAWDRLQTEAEIQKLASFAQLNPNAAMELSSDGSVTYCNEAALRLALSVGLDHPHLLLPTSIQEIIRAALGSSRTPTLETHVVERTLAWSFHPVPCSRKVHCYIQDITEQINLAAQLRQSQKMDSLGHLAAGVAHDFNNMLTVIQGHSSMLVARLPQHPELQESAHCVHFAAERAAALTKQLLMFSRKSVMQPRLLDLAECLGQLASMLNRLLGEHIDLEFNPPGALPMVRGDSGMIEQVVMNLAVNARDAMPGGGRLSIQLEKVEITPEYIQRQPEGRLGEFIRLRVTDNGEGMSEETMNRSVEPFFTTKEVGKGTGLGLATVFGTVKQHEGWLETESRLGVGTTISIYLPATDVISKPQARDDKPSGEVRGGQEAVLLVEDESTLRDMAAMILQECGYKVLKAANGVEAFSLWRLNQDTVDLVLTDMVMPEGLTGLELANKLSTERPGLKILFTSGYSIEDIGAELARHPNTRFLEKPYTRLSLAAAVREILDAEALPDPDATIVTTDSEFTAISQS